jgi:Cu(I)/Ag(I) efflux system membrane protein CusA/SilA
MAIAAVLAITLDPALRMMFARIDPYRFRPRWLAWLATAIVVGRYRARSAPDQPAVALAVRAAVPVRAAPPEADDRAGGALVAATVPIYLRLGSEFMPPLREGTILYMPSAVQPGMSVAEAQKALQVQDKILRLVPRGRARVRQGRPRDHADRPGAVHDDGDDRRAQAARSVAHPARWYSSWAPDWIKPALRPFWDDRISQSQLEAEMNQALQLPGISNAWTMPIKGRLDMLSTGVRTPVGIKILGSDLATIERLAREVEAVLVKVPGTRGAFAERVAGGYFLDFVLKRDRLARYGLTVDDANLMVMTAVGGDNQSVTIEGRERYGINVRYARDYREDLPALRRVLLPLPGGRGQIPMEEIADVVLTQGPAMIRDENGLLAGYVYVDFDTDQVDIGGYVTRAKRAVAAAVTVPPGYAMVWSGQYENMLRVKERLKLVLPLTLVLIFFLLYMNTRSAWKAGLVLLAVPFSAVGAMWLLWLLDYNLSIAVWVGLIALMGLDAETGVFMLLFLDLACDERAAEGRLRTRGDLHEAIIHGAVKRVRPKAMTVFAAMLGLLPIMWSIGTGADLMKRVAAPMVGGLVTSFALELLVYPPIYYLVRARRLPAGAPTPAAAPAVDYAI